MTQQPESLSVFTSGASFIGGIAGKKHSELVAAATAGDVAQHAVGVGQVQWTRIVALPGPTREVDAALPVIVQGLGEGWSLQRLADELAVAIRACMR